MLVPWEVEDWDVEIYQPGPDNLFRPMPNGRLSWDDPDNDAGGFPERIRYFEIYAAPDPASAESMDPSFLIDQTYRDDEPDVPGFQYYVYEPLEPPTFYSVV